jgi:hypothetical protein
VQQSFTFSIADAMQKPKGGLTSEVVDDQGFIFHIKGPN